MYDLWPQTSKSRCCFLAMFAYVVFGRPAPPPSKVQRENSPGTSNDAQSQGTAAALCGAWCELGQHIQGQSPSSVLGCVIISTGKREETQEASHTEQICVRFATSIARSFENLKMWVSLEVAHQATSGSFAFGVGAAWSRFCAVRRCLKWVVTASLWYLSTSLWVYD